MESKQIDLINNELQTWCQGDFVLGEQWFVHRFNPQFPLTPDSTKQDAEENDLVESEVKGLVVVTQTCDIVRYCCERPFLENVLYYSGFFNPS